MAATLDELGIEFAEQVSTRSGFVIDFAVYVDRSKGQKVAIEVDGLLWHSSGKQRRRDAFRDMILRRSGWTVIRFNESFTMDDVEMALTTAKCCESSVRRG